MEEKGKTVKENRQHGSINLPTELSWQGPMAENWRLFRQKFEIYLIASDNEGKSPRVKTALLLNAIGERCIKIYNTFVFEKAEHGNDINKVTQKFEDHFNPEKNETYERYRFFTRMQKDGESYEDFVVVLRDLSSTCNFGVLTESLIKDRLVCGITDTTVKDRLLRTKDLTLDKAINICRISQETRMQLEKITLAHTPDNAHSSNSSDYNINKFNEKQNKLTKSGFTGQLEKKYKENFNYDKKLCKRCGYNHPMRKCPAYGKRCVRCNGYNHFSSQCRNHCVHEIIIQSFLK
ncbi:uncharacterized protein LOC123867071 [Maniola jurtina]|uniref:uncharacterized protein LOC123867071 n=1 Tax=Maniola jurtina TaxID=191418 RepID=UPI001E68BE7B|nr:uncharacterized protein LOC123867071 [Maniola jurtina]